MRNGKTFKIAAINVMLPIAGYEFWIDVFQVGWLFPVGNFNSKSQICI